ncbi:MAG: hypothetical protein ACO1QB_06555 [Verrucomicrobiales bacterium]
MLLKISLGLAILIGLVTLYFTHVQVGGKVDQLASDYASTKSTLETTQQSEARARKDLKDTKGQLDMTSKNLMEATNSLAQVTAIAEEQRSRADKASTDLARTTEERNEARQELTRWNVLGLSIEQLQQRLSQTASLTKERDAIAQENKSLDRENKGLKRQLTALLGGEEIEVEVPPGTRANVLAVDPKYDFVVLDIGGNQGILENAKLIINRDGKFIGKVRVTAVEPNRSVANVMPEWKQDEIMEGDIAISQM